MPAPATNSELTDVILKSGVIEDARLKNYLKKLGDSAEGAPTEPSKLAGLMVRDGILTYFQAEQLLQGKWKRFFIGKYKVLERLGAGGMGQVFLCEHKLMKRRVAVKVLPVAKSQDEAALSRFIREAKAAASVDHPNVVRAYDIDQDENLHFIVMEFVDGANFHELVKKHGPMDILRACHYIYGATVGLHHSHEMGLIHRDIKPANILVDRSGVVKLLDMGLARFSQPDDNDNLTQRFDENVLGTADYLAPEQAIDSSSVDIRADIYGLGGTFYYILTGLPPFPEGTVAQKLLWHQTKTPKSIRAIRPEIPEGLETIVNRMLAKSVEERFQSPAELMAALAPWVQTPIPPPPDHEMPQLSAAASSGFATKAGPGSGAPLATGSSVYVTPAPITSTSTFTQPSLKSTGMPAIPVSASYGPSARPALATLAPAKAIAVEAPAVWESITSETLGNAPADTADTKKKPKPAKGVPEAPAPAKAPEKKKTSLLPWIIAAAVGFVGVAALAGATIYFMTKNDAEDDVPPPTPPRVPHKWYVSGTGYGPELSYTRKTIQDAIKDARNGDTISILDDRIEVPYLQFGYSNPKQKMTLHVEAGNESKNVLLVFKPAVGGRVQVALDFVNLEDSTIDGITLEPGLAEIGIRIQGHCSGTQFQNIAVKGVKKTGIQLNGLEAADGKPLSLSKFRITPVGTEKMYDCAIDVVGARSDNIRMTDGRLEGSGKGSALRIDGTATNIEFRNNRVFNWEQGIFVTGKDDKAKPLGLMLIRNTFHSLKAAGLYAEAPIELPGRKVSIEGNLFVKTGELVKVQLPSTGVKAEANGMADNSKEGIVNIKAEPAIGFGNAPVKTESGDAFLRGANGVRPTIGKDKIPVGIE